MIEFNDKQELIKSTDKTLSGENKLKKQIKTFIILYLFWFVVHTHRGYWSISKKTIKEDKSLGE